MMFFRIYFRCKSSLLSGNLDSVQQREEKKTKKKRQKPKKEQKKLKAFA